MPIGERGVARPVCAIVSTCSKIEKQTSSGLLSRDWQLSRREIFCVAWSVCVVSERIRYSHNGSPVAVGTRLVCEKAGCDERSRLLDGSQKATSSVMPEQRV